MFPTQHHLRTTRLGTQLLASPAAPPAAWTRPQPTGNDRVHRPPAPAARHEARRHHAEHPFVNSNNMGIATAVHFRNVVGLMNEFLVGNGGDPVVRTPVEIRTPVRTLVRPPHLPTLQRAGAPVTPQAAPRTPPSVAPARQPQHHRPSPVTPQPAVAAPGRRPTIAHAQQVHARIGPFDIHARSARFY